MTGEKGGHELYRVIGLQICGPVRDHGIADTVGLVESVAGERQYQLEDLRGQLLCESLGRCPLHKPLPLLCHQGGDLLPHGLPHDVRLSETVAREHPKN